MSQGKLSPTLFNNVLPKCTAWNTRSGAPGRGGAKGMVVCLAAMCEPVDTAQSLGDVTHAMAKGGCAADGGVSARTSHGFVVQCVVGRRACTIRKVLEQGRGQT